MTADGGTPPRTTGNGRIHTTPTTDTPTTRTPTGGAAPGEVTERDRELVRAAIAALPPLTDEQVDGLCDVILNARLRWEQHDRQPRRAA